MKETKQISPSISLELYQELKEIAEKEECSLSRIVRVMLKESLKEWKKKARS